MKDRKAAENSRAASAGRIVGRPFKPGVSGNPGGRPTALRRAVREATRDGQDLVEMMMRVLAGRPVRVKGRLYRATIEDRMEAATWLADRGFGKPSTMAEMLLVESYPPRRS
jgi:hypothetical protein